jgi:hypothetical protein
MKEEIKKTKFRQSVALENTEQFYYDQARQMMKDLGYASVGNLIKNELPNIPIESLKITKDRFVEILNIAQKDYMSLLFDPLGVESTF